MGGFALLNFYVTYLVYPLEISATAIEYYAPPADLFARVYLAFINLALIASVARCEAGHIASREAELWHLNGAPWVDGPEGKGVVKPMDICMSARCKVNCLPGPSAPEPCLP